MASGVAFERPASGHNWNHGINMIFAVNGPAKFEYQLLASDRSPMGVLKLPSYPALPSNSFAARVIPDVMDDFVNIQLTGRQYRVDYQLLGEQAFHGSDLKFFLMDGTTILATAEVHALKKDRWAIEANSRHYDLVRKNQYFRMRFDLEQNGKLLGRIRHVSGFTLRQRTFEIDLPPQLENAVQVFLFFLSANATFR